MKILVSRQKVLHRLFQVSIIVKSINGVWEIATGFVFLFFTGPVLREFAARHISHDTVNFSLNTQHFIGWYFLLYGLVNIFLVICLYMRKLWAYPVAISCLTLLVVYQAYRIVQYQSILLAFLTLFDIIFIMLVVSEHRRVKELNETN